MFLVIDCKDSFVYNLVSCFESSGVRTKVLREDNVDTNTLMRLNPDAVVLSPGPGRPSQERGSAKVMEVFADDVPILGVCLGHQCICAHFGAEISEGSGPMHGKVVRIKHTGEGLFKGIPDNFNAVRYNSLTAVPSTIPQNIKIDAVDKRGDVMAISHCHLPIFGVQFHPESFMTEHGIEIIVNFISEVRS